MKTILSLLFASALAVAAVASANAQTALNGAGATFPYPVYSKWAYKYNQVTGVRINYQSIGSGAGIAQIKAKTVDFGASDAPLEKAELDAAGLIQFPLVMGGVVPVVNVPGVPAGKLRLSPDVLANIFLGTVKKWNDPAIASLNPGLALPNRAIAVVHRSDGSGTTWIFTNYLDKVSPAWHAKVGTEKAVPWPTGIGGKGNEGVAAYVQRIQGAIGYVEFAYAIENKMTTVMLKNAAGSFVAPSIESFQAAAASADWKNAPGFRMVLTNQPGAGSWPITGASFIIVQKQQKNPKNARDMLAFFDWCYTHGGDIAKSLAYVPVPEPVAQLVRALWAKEVSAGGKPVWTAK